MKLLKSVIKPYYLNRPEFFFKSILFRLGFFRLGWSETTTAFGSKIHCDNSDAIGRSIFKNGIYELATSELVWRVLPPGGTFVDVGANIGYFTCLAAEKLKGHGRVVSYEPSEALFGWLTRNTKGYDIVSCKQAAVSNRAGKALLYYPKDHESNNGVATLEFREGLSQSTSVPAVRLGEEVSTINVLKVDVEGHELSVLEGATGLLGKGGTDYVIFEDHNIAVSGVKTLLSSLGYHIFSIGWDFGGVNIKPLDEPNPTPITDAPNYVATLKPSLLLSMMAPRGWLILRRPKEA